MREYGRMLVGENLYSRIFYAVIMQEKLKFKIYHFKLRKGQKDRKMGQKSGEFLFE